MPTLQQALEEFVVGGLSTSVACVFSNPFEVTKTRMQLQGELKAKGTYERHYRNLFHAMATIVRVEGWWALQKGLGPALTYQFVMNGARLGTYQVILATWCKGPEGKGSPKFHHTVLAGAIAGGLGGAVASPLYLVKTHLQSMSMQEIAVGHQYKHKGMVDALHQIYAQHGLKGLWRGVNGAIARLSLGSALQLSTFSWIKTRVKQSGWFSDAFVPVVASMISSVNIVVFMEPFDVVRTRLYNQPVDAKGRGLYYRGFLHCFMEISGREGLTGFYKGAWAAYFRMAPQAIIGLSLWDNMRRLLVKGE